MTAARSACPCARSGERGYYREVDINSSVLADLMQRARCTKGSFLDDKSSLSLTKNEAHDRYCACQGVPDERGLGS